MGIANIINNSTTTSGGEIVRELVNSSDGAGLHLEAGGTITLTNAAAAEFGTSDFSLEFVLNRTANNTNNNVIYESHSSGNNRITLKALTGGDLVATFTNSSGVNADYNTGYDIDVDLNTVTHYALTFDRSGDLTVYKNGNSVATISIAASSAVDIGASNTNTGRIGYVTTYGVIGTFYRFRTWNKALSSAEVQTAFERADVDFADQYGSQTELITNSVDRNFTGGSSGWVNQGMSSYDDTGDLSITADASDDYVYLPSGRLGTLTNGNRYALTVTASALSGGSFKIIFGGSNQVVASAITSGANNHEFIYDSSGNGNLLIQSNTNAGSITLDNFSLRKVGAVSDYDLALANPTQSLTVQDRSGAADGTCSASGVTQVQPVVQLNATAARIGTSAGTPADRELLLDKYLKFSDIYPQIVTSSTASEMTISGGNATSNGANIGLRGSTHGTPSSVRFRSGTTTTLSIDSSGDTTLAGKLKLDDASVAGWIQSDGSVRIDIDNDDSSTDRAFVVSRDNASATLFSVNELGLAEFSGGINLGHETITKYDEGTFTPTLQFGGATTGITYGSIRGGVYTRIGRLVYVQVAFALTSKGTATGNATITGMPFACGDLIPNTTIENAFSFALFNNLSVEPSAFIAGTTMTLRTLNGTNLTDSDFINSSAVRIAGCYALASS